MEVLEGAEDQRRLRVGAELAQRLVALPVLLIGEMDLDAFAGLADFRLGVIRDGDVDRAGAGMEEVNRPEIEGAAGEVDPGRRGDGDQRMLSAATRWLAGKNSPVIATSPSGNESGQASRLSRIQT